MKKKFLTYLLPLLIIAVGAAISFSIGKIFDFGEVDIFIIIPIAIVFCLLEINVIKNFPETLLVYMSLDGKMFPFFRLGWELA
jgi:hypothetical protein